MNRKNNDVSDKLKKFDLRVTPQRVAVYQAVYKNKAHPNADSVYKIVREKIPSISFDTVNRTLTTFAQQGIINTVEGYSFSKRYDGDINNHHHLLCLKCGQIFDFIYKPFDKLKTPDTIPKNFKVLNKKIFLQGYCNKCNKSS